MITQSKKDGLWGEVLVSRWYRDRKYCVETANFRTRLGEIDLILKKKNLLVFCEVKTRRKAWEQLPREAVDAHKQRRLMNTALQYIARIGYQGPFRFDVAEVLLDDNGGHTINVIENAFEA